VSLREHAAKARERVKTKPGVNPGINPSRTLLLAKAYRCPVVVAVVVRACTRSRAWLALEPARISLLSSWVSFSRDRVRPYFPWFFSC